MSGLTLPWPSSCSSWPWQGWLMGTQSGSPCGWEQRGQTWEGTESTWNTGDAPSGKWQSSHLTQAWQNGTAKEHKPPAHSSSLGALLWHCFLGTSSWLILLSYLYWQSPCLHLWCFSRGTSSNRQALIAVHLDKMPGKTQLVV